MVDRIVRTLFLVRSAPQRPINQLSHSVLGVSLHHACSATRTVCFRTHLQKFQVHCNVQVSWRLRGLVRWNVVVGPQTGQCRAKREEELAKERCFKGGVRVMSAWMMTTMMMMIILYT